VTQYFRHLCLVLALTLASSQTYAMKNHQNHQQPVGPYFWFDQLILANQFVQILYLIGPIARTQLWSVSHYFRRILNAYQAPQYHQSLIPFQAPQQGQGWTDTLPVINSISYPGDNDEAPIAIGNYLYLVSMGGVDFENFRNTSYYLSVFNPALFGLSNASPLIASILVDRTRAPFGVGEYVCLVNEVSGTLTIINPSLIGTDSNPVVASIPIANEPSHPLVLGTRILFSSRSRNLVTVVDTALIGVPDANLVIESIPVGQHPQTPIAFDNMIFVADDRQITVLDSTQVGVLNANPLITTIPRAVFSLQRFGAYMVGIDGNNNEIVVIDPAQARKGGEATIAAVVQIGGDWHLSSMVSIGSYVFVSGLAPVVHVIDLERVGVQGANPLIASISVAGGLQDGETDIPIVFGSYLLVPTGFSNYLDVIDPALIGTGQNPIICTLRPRDRPHALTGLSPYLLYLAEDEYDSSVSILDTRRLVKASRILRARRVENPNSIIQSIATIANIEVGNFPCSPVLIGRYIYVIADNKLTVIDFSGFLNGR